MQFCEKCYVLLTIFKLFPFLFLLIVMTLPYPPFSACNVILLPILSSDLMNRDWGVYSHCKSGEDVLQVLRHMTEDGHVPSVDLCAFLLEKSLAASDYVVLRVLTGWYLDNYTTAHLDYGSVSMILQVPYFMLRY